MSGIRTHNTSDYKVIITTIRSRPRTGRVAQYFEGKLISGELLYINNLILKLYMYIPYSYRVFTLPYGTRFSKNKRKENTYKYTFLIICRYLNVVNDQTIIS